MMLASYLFNCNYLRDTLLIGHMTISPIICTFKFHTSTGATKEEAKKVIEEDLKEILTGLARHLFGDVEMRWREDYFPFTEPSFELDIFFNGDWMEVLGCGVIHDEVMANAGKFLCCLPLFYAILEQ